MTGSRPEKSMTVAAYSSPLSVTTAVELWRGSYGQRATPLTRSSTLLMLPTWGRKCKTEDVGKVSNKLSKRAFLWRPPPNCYLSGDTQRLEGIGPAGHDLGLVHQQDSDVVLTFDLRGDEGEEVGESCGGADGG